MSFEEELRKSHRQAQADQETGANVRALMDEKIKDFMGDKISTHLPDVADGQRLNDMGIKPPNSLHAVRITPEGKVSNSERGIS